MISPTELFSEHTKDIEAYIDQQLKAALYVNGLEVMGKPIRIELPKRSVTRFTYLFIKQRYSEMDRTGFYWDVTEVAEDRESDTTWLEFRYVSMQQKYQESFT